MKTWYIIGAVVIVALGLWYFYGGRSAAPYSFVESSAVEQTQLPPLSSGNTVADISADLSQTPDPSTALDKDASVSSQAVSAF